MTRTSNFFLFMAKILVLPLSLLRQLGGRSGLLGVDFADLFVVGRHCDEPGEGGARDAAATNCAGGEVQTTPGGMMDDWGKGLKRMAVPGGYIYVRNECTYAGWLKQKPVRKLCQNSANTGACRVADPRIREGSAVAPDGIASEAGSRWLGMPAATLASISRAVASAASPPPPSLARLMSSLPSPFGRILGHAT